MKRARLERIFQMILASAAIGARGSPCGTCPEATTTTIPLLPESPGDAAGLDTNAPRDAIDGDAQDSAEAAEAADAADGDTAASDTDAADDAVADTAVDTAPAERPDAEVDACAIYCRNAVRCTHTTVGWDGGTIPALQCDQISSCGAGRRPRGLSSAATALPALVALARLEAAAVEAFRVLRADLRRVGAPRRLLRSVSRARRDEVRHARVTAALAGVPRNRKSRFVGAHAPDLCALAVDNAVEGQVRETFGALQALALAASTADRHLRDALVRIARDETRHAELAFALDRWLRPRLDPGARAAVAASRRAAAAELARSHPTLAGPLFSALGFA